AEDGIRDLIVTGVQTCALPISFSHGDPQEAFWGSPCENVLDRATAMLPRFLYERLDDLGMDFCVVYPTAGLGYHRLQDTRLRREIGRASCRERGETWGLRAGER